jgi:hypothetical protein
VSISVTVSIVKCDVTSVIKCVRECRNVVRSPRLNRLIIMRPGAVRVAKRATMVRARLEVTIFRSALGAIRARPGGFDCSINFSLSSTFGETQAASEVRAPVVIDKLKFIEHGLGNFFGRVRKRAQILRSNVVFDNEIDGTIIATDLFRATNAEFEADQIGGNDENSQWS